MSQTGIQMDAPPKAMTAACPLRSATAHAATHRKPTSTTASAHEGIASVMTEPPREGNTGVSMHHECLLKACSQTAIRQITARVTCFPLVFLSLFAVSTLRASWA